MVNQRIERLEVLEPCLKLCKKLKIAGYIIKYRRLDALDTYHESGDPDIEIWFKRNNLLCIFMVECKKPIGGVLSHSQILCKGKFSNLDNVIYEVITDVKSLSKRIIDCADNINHNPEQFKEMQEFNNDTNN